LQIYCIFLFLCAASLFGTIIAQVNEIVAQITTKTKDLDGVLEGYLEVRPPIRVQTMLKVREWERFKFLVDYEHRQQKDILQRQLPEVLKLAIAQKIEDNLFSKVAFMVGLDAIGDMRTLFAGEVGPQCSKLTLRSETQCFSKGSIIADSNEEAKGLMVITSGQVGAEIPIDSDDADEENKSKTGKTLLYVFERGDSIGDCSLAGDKRWAGSYGVSVDFVARSHCSVEYISVEDVKVWIYWKNSSSSQ